MYYHISLRKAMVTKMTDIFQQFNFFQGSI